IVGVRFGEEQEGRWFVGKEATPGTAFQRQRDPSAVVRLVDRAATAQMRRELFTITVRSAGLHRGPGFQHAVPLQIRRLVRPGYPNRGPPCPAQPAAGSVASTTAGRVVG